MTCDPRGERPKRIGGMGDWPAGQVMEWWAETWIPECCGM